MSFSHVHQLCAPRDFPEQEVCQWNGKSSTDTTSSSESSFVNAVQEMDWIAGEILNAIDTLGIANNTMVWFTSDNGPWVAEQLCSGSKGPFEGRWLQDFTSLECTACPHDYLPRRHTYPYKQQERSDQEPRKNLPNQEEVQRSNSVPYDQSENQEHDQEPRVPSPHECYLPGTNFVLDGVPCGHDTGLGSVWEANLRMPAMIRWPSQISPKSVSSLPVSTLDVLPTILSVVDGGQTPTTLSDRNETLKSTRHRKRRMGHDTWNGHMYRMDGMDLTPLMQLGSDTSKGFTTDELEKVWNNRPLFFWRDGFETGPLSPPFGRVDVAAVKLGPYKLWFWTKSGHYNDDVEQYHDPPLLFDVLADPAEAFPLNPSDHADLIQRAKVLTKRHKDEMTLGKPLTLERDEQAIPCVDRATKCRTRESTYEDATSS